MVYVKDLPFVQSFDMDQILAQEGILDALKNLSQWLIVLVRKTYKNMVGLVLGIFIMFFSLFYFFIEGEKLVQKILYLSPLKSSQEALLMNKFVSISRATIKGALTVAVIQGLIGGLAFFITGVPATAIWTMLMIILSMIPLLGSGFVWFPVGVWMLIAGKIWQGIVILVVGFGIISTIDNLLRPKLVGQDIQMHPLLVFFTTLGGIAAFGIVGFILGPIIMAFFLTLLEIYKQEFKQHLEAMNKI
jgi:predicted PurR-regulated permease PerM